MGARLLFVGDIHLGRRPGSLPQAVEDLGCRPADLGPAAAWRATWERALAEGVDAVVLAGDVVESVEDRIEGWAHLERGVRALAEAGIAVFGVAGNHDVLALPALADRIPGFRLLGRGGVWEIAACTAQDGSPFRLLGWSFPQQHVTANPLATLPAELPGAGPLLGVLHADVDARGSSFAPVPRAQLEAAPVAAWFLGHVHAPGALSAPRPLGYLGSLVGLDPGEPGRHGPWLVRLEAGDRVVPEQIALAPIRWERRDLGLTGIEGRDGAARDALEERLLRALEELHEELRPDLGAARAVGCRFTLRGSCAAHREIADFVSSGRPADLYRQLDGVTYFVEKLIDDGHAAVDFDELAAGRDPIALLARRLRALERGGAECEVLLARAAARFQPLSERAVPWGSLDGPAREVDLRATLLRSGRRVLDELLAQRAALQKEPEAMERAAALPAAASLEEA